MSSFRKNTWPWLRERLFPHGTDLIQWAAYVIIVGMMIAQAISPSDPRPAVFNSVMMALTALLLMNILWDDLTARFATETQGDWALLLISAALIFYCIIGGKMYNGIYLVFMAVAQANAMLPVIPALTYSAVLAGGYMAALAGAGATPAELRSISGGMVIGLTFTITLSQALNRYILQSEEMKRLLDALQEANLALMEAREKEKELTIAEERVRMARDLHDGLGHHLTALSIQLQAAEKLARTNPDLAAEAVRNARGEVQAALKEVRQSVAALRQTPVDLRQLPGTLKKLVEEAGLLSGFRARFNQQGEPAELSPAVAMTLYRTAQEGLTNVQKHAASPGEVCVELLYEEAWVRLAVEDDGAPGDLPAQEENGCAGSGFGLAGLRERALLLGGSLECGPTPRGGFRLEIRLPQAGAERERP